MEFKVCIPSAVKKNQTLTMIENLLPFDSWNPVRSFRLFAKRKRKNEKQCELTHTFNISIVFHDRESKRCREAQKKLGTLLIVVWFTLSIIAPCWLDLFGQVN